MGLLMDPTLPCICTVSYELRLLLNLISRQFRIRGRRLDLIGLLIGSPHHQYS